MPSSTGTTEVIQTSTYRPVPRNGTRDSDVEVTSFADLVDERIGVVADGDAEPEAGMRGPQTEPEDLVAFAEVEQEPHPRLAELAVEVVLRSPRGLDVAVVRESRVRREFLPVAEGVEHVHRYGQHGDR